MLRHEPHRRPARLSSGTQRHQILNDLAVSASILIFHRHRLPPPLPSCAFIQPSCFISRDSLIYLLQKAPCPRRRRCPGATQCGCAVAGRLKRYRHARLQPVDDWPGKAFAEDFQRLISRRSGRRTAPATPISFNRPASARTSSGGDRKRCSPPAIARTGRSGKVRRRLVEQLHPRRRACSCCERPAPPAQRARDSARGRNRRPQACLARLGNEHPGPRAARSHVRTAVRQEVRAFADLRNAVHAHQPAFQLRQQSAAHADVLRLRAVPRIAILPHRPADVDRRNTVGRAKRSQPVRVVVVGVRESPRRPAKDPRRAWRSSPRSGCSRRRRAGIACPDARSTGSGPIPTAGPPGHCSRSAR